MNVPVVTTDYALDDRYRKDAGRAYVNGMQALVRLLLVQRRRDMAAGLNTAGFVSGYRGSPLGTLDMALWQAVLNAALCGMGLTVLFAHSVLRYLQSGELKVLLPDWSPHGATSESNIVYLRYPHRAYLPFNVRVLVDFLTERFREPARVKFDPRQWAAK